MKFKSDIEAQAAIRDASNSPGTANQILSSTVSGTAWINPGAIGGGYLPLSAGSGYPLTGDLYGTSAFFTGNVGIGTSSPGTQKLYVDGGETTFNRGNTDGAIATFRGKNNEKAVIGTLTSYFTGNVGIGTTSPVGKFNSYISATRQVAHNGNGGDLSVISDNNSNPVFFVKGTGNADLVNVFDNTTKVFTILNGGNVGIGTSSPTSNLEVVGNGGTVLDVQGSQGQLFSVTDSLSGSIFAVSDISGVPILDVNSSGTSYFSGNVGIGTSTPAQKLHIAGERLRLDGTHIEINPTSASTSYLSSGTNTTNFFIRNRDAGVLTFGTSDLERMRITSGGNVGIGTTNPQVELHVKGNNGWGEVRVEGQTFASGHGGALEFYSEGTALADVYANTSKDLILRTNGSTERMRITAAGNVGIGTTSPNQRLQVRTATTTDSSFQGINVHNNGTTGTRAGISFQAYDWVQSAIWHGRGMTPTSESGALVLGTNPNTTDLTVSGVVARMVINNAGAVKFNAYGAGTLVTDASGNITVSSGGGAGGPYLPLAAGAGNKLTSDLYIDTTIRDTNAEIVIRRSSNIIRLGSGSGSDVINAYSGGQIALTLDASQNATFAGDARFNGRVRIGDVSGLTDRGTVRIDTKGDAPADLLFGRDTAGTATGWTGVYWSLSSRGSAESNNFKLYRGTAHASPYNSEAVPFQIAPDLSATFAGTVTSVGTVTAPTFSGDLNGTINTVTTAVTKANATNDTTVATTAFVQNLIGTIPAGLVFQGTWNAATNTPTLTSGSGTTGHFYIVSTSGSTNLDGVTDWVTGDWAVFIEQGGTDAWEKIDNSSVLDGAGTGQTVAKWDGSGTSNTLTNSSITDTGSAVTISNPTTITGPLTVNIDADDTVVIKSVGTNASAIFAASGDELYVGGGDNWSARFPAGNNYALFDNSNARVGIGTGSPNTFLHVAGQGNRSGGNIYLGNQDDGSTKYGLITSAHFDAATNPEGITLITGLSTATENTVSIGGFVYESNPATDIRFFTHTATTHTTGGSERMRIISNGNVGIGTGNPERKLHVFAGESGGAASNTQSTLVLENSTNTYLQFLTPVSSDSGILFGDTDNDRGALIYGHGSDTMSFVVAASTKMTILSGGNVGIGTTSPDSKLDVRGADLPPADGNQTLSITNTTGGTQLNMGTAENNYGWIEAREGATLRNLLLNPNGGNVGIGTTSPTSKLFVNDTVDGDKIRWGKSDALIGSLGTYNGVPYIGYQGGGGGGIMFNGASIEPTLLGSSRSSNTNDVGSSSYKWRNAYFGNQVSAASYIAAAAEGLRINDDAAYISGYNTAGTQRTGYIQFLNGSGTILIDSEINNRYIVMAPTSTAKVGIGTSAPQSKLQVAGGIQMADDTDAAAAAKVGTMRYRTGTEYVEVDGVNIVTNGDFLSSPASSGWTLPATGWTITTGNATWNAAGTYSWISSSVGTVVGNVYKVSFDCVVTSGNLFVVLADGGATPAITATGSYEYILTPTAGGGANDTLIRVYQTVANSNFSITNISAVQVTAEDASYADMCMQTGASTYEWVNIVRNTY